MKSLGRLAPLLIACAAATATVPATAEVPAMTTTAPASAQPAELTIDRLFDAPALSGPSITDVQISPDGSRVTYLQGKADDKDRLDLWEYNLHDKVARVLVDSNTLSPSRETLSAEEIDRRERLRTAALSGIVEYSFAPSGKALLFPLGGRLYLYDLTKAAEGAPAKPAADDGGLTKPTGGSALTEITDGSQGFATDAGISPRGTHIAYIANQNLHVYDLAAHSGRALTQDGGGPIKNGMAEFIAQEEMDRSTGYWWAPDDRHIAFARVDESPIPETLRFEIAADNVATFPQRYPVTGGPNVLVRLGVIDVHTGSVTWIDLGADPDIYLARVNWLPDGKTLAIQRQSRDQKRVDLLFADIATGASRVMLTESSSTWVALNDEISFLKHSREFVWASARDGFLHLYLYDLDGRLIRRLTQGPWVVEDMRGRAVKAIDEKHRLIYFVATEASPIERQLYRTSLDTRDPRQVTRISREAGLHAVTFARGARFYVDHFTSISQPPQVAVHAADGSLLAYLLENRLDAAHPDAPYVADNAVPEFGTLAAADGQPLHYKLFKPPHFDASRRYPAIVEVYGGPGVQRVLDVWSGADFTQILTRAGYVVFQLDNRGSSGRGTAFESPIHGRLGQVEVADQARGAEWLGAQPFVDPARLGVWGWSYGGYMTLMLMLQAPEVFKAGISGAPVTDWRLYDTHYTERYLERPADNAAGYDASSVLPYADKLRGRLLVIHGMADDNVLFLNSTKLFRRLQDLKAPFDVMVYPGAKHGLLRQHDGRHSYATMLRFFDEALRPGGLPASR